jgi:hypothetical protein
MAVVAKIYTIASQEECEARLRKSLVFLYTKNSPNPAKAVIKEMGDGNFCPR